MKSKKNKNLQNVAPQIIIAILVIIGIQLSACKKSNDDLVRLPLTNQTNEVVIVDDDATIIENFIIQVNNSVSNTGTNYDDLALIEALEKIEHSVN